jgi:hypothetical protein
MAFFFKTKKSPPEIVKSIQKNLIEMVDDKTDEKGVKKVWPCPASFEWCCVDCRWPQRVVCLLLFLLLTPLSSFS